MRRFPTFVKTGRFSLGNYNEGMQYLLPDEILATCEAMRALMVVKNDKYTRYFFTNTSLSFIKFCHN